MPFEPVGGAIRTTETLLELAAVASVVTPINDVAQRVTIPKKRATTRCRLPRSRIPPILFIIILLISVPTFTMHQQTTCPLTPPTAFTADQTRLTQGKSPQFPEFDSLVTRWCRPFG